MPLTLLKYGLRSRHVSFRDIPATPDLKKSYDVVIIGGGGHGLAAAYYLSNIHGIRSVAKTIATGHVPDILLPFDMRRFDSFALLNEMGATAASH